MRRVKRTVRKTAFASILDNLQPFSTSPVKSNTRLELSRPTLRRIRRLSKQLAAKASSTKAYAADPACCN